MFCRNCGKELQTNAKFCNECGKAVDNNVSSVKTISSENKVITKKDKPPKKDAKEHNIFKRFLGWIALVAMIFIVFCVPLAYSYECDWCGETPTIIIKNEKTDEYVHYCIDCRTKCWWCGEKATNRYISLADIVVFACDDCYYQ